MSEPIFQQECGHHAHLHFLELIVKGRNVEDARKITTAIYGKY